MIDIVCMRGIHMHSTISDKIYNSSTGPSQGAGPASAAVVAAVGQT